MAGDHGVVAEDVSVYPPEVTAQMVGNFLRGGAAINVLARYSGADLVVVGMRVAGEVDGPSREEGRSESGAPSVTFARHGVARGTRNITQGPIISPAQAAVARQTGIAVSFTAITRGAQLVATGDMGIGNTAAFSAIVAALTGAPAAEVTERGTGIDDGGLARKVDAIERALRRNSPDPSDPLDVLSKVGGFEIAGLARVILTAAFRRVPAVVDGFISGAAALVAAWLDPQVTAYLLAAHRSVEVGHTVMIDALGLVPLLDLGLRLGEGSGAAIALSIVDAAARLLNEMASFSEAGVANRERDGHM